MGLALEHSPFISVQDYLEGEKVSEIRHEYVDGVVEAMSEASRRHQLINGNIVALLHNHLKGNPCSVYASGFKVQLKNDITERYYYPDVLVDCKPEIEEDSYWTDDPVLVMEILSPSTMRQDMNEKLEAYKLIPSLQEILIISQSLPLIFSYTRANNWEPESIDLKKKHLSLESIQYPLHLKDVYEGIEF